ncbi:hypothetical protein [Actinoplanes regularis]|uniref:Uncharacterized protein n=1 Tax=Actinoplanes regularis TaxID=52697 RepID=A0A238YS93_9ACTN|nr:hypothetical protein [Actinoplanes regularis]GIE85488.1 hypothetical protein Are01nite_19680 [Actinoplanes regularis]SNR73473.1 hypothetical protein SAMN06264365_105107 [Actinoplanes regularis]
MTWSDSGLNREATRVDRLPRYGIAVLVSFIWHFAAFAAVWLNTLVDREDTSCDDAPSFCFTAKDGAELLLMAGGVFLVSSMVVSLMTAAWLSRRIRSAVLAGTVAALVAGVVVIAILIALFLANILL